MKYFLLGRGNISSPGDFVMGDTLFVTQAASYFSVNRKSIGHFE